MDMKIPRVKKERKQITERIATLFECENSDKERGKKERGKKGRRKREGRVGVLGSFCGVLWENYCKQCYASFCSTFEGQQNKIALP
jgi:hypothetical protein